MSFGKDSLAMVLKLIELKMPLDEVVFYDTGMEFQAIYNIRDKMLPVFEENHIRYIEMKPQESFMYTMLERPVYSKEKGEHKGYGWCGGVCRWGTTEKLKALDRYAEDQNAEMYIAIAADEAERAERNTKTYKRYPLIEWGMKEADCLEYCRRKGISWQECGIDLYDILDRVSCWCCCNKNKKELRNIWLYLREYWERLKDLQRQLERPMKKFRSQKYGDYGNVFLMEKVFEEEQRNRQMTLNDWRINEQLKSNVQQQIF